MRTGPTLFKEMSTKSNDNALELGVVTHTGIRSLQSWRRILTNAGLQLAYFSGAARISERYNGRAGIILKFEHVRPPRHEPFQPLRSHEISPEFLDRAITALKRWKFDFVSIDQIGERMQQAAPARRFVTLSFDGGSRDFMTFAYPVLSRHRVPFTLYAPTGFVDGVASAWWLALEQVVARNARIALVMDRVERRFNVSRLSEKYELYEILHDWMLTLSPDELAIAINDLCGRYGVDLKSVSRDIAMSWQDLTMLARDPRATIGCATVNYPNLARTKGTTVLREMTMGRMVLETALGRPCQHFAYPFGARGTFGPRDMQLAREAGFVTAVSAGPGLFRADGQSNLMALPRIAWDGRRRSLRALRVILSGITIRNEKQRKPEAEVNYG